MAQKGRDLAGTSDVTAKESACAKQKLKRLGDVAKRIFFKAIIQYIKVGYNFSFKFQ